MSTDRWNGVVAGGIAVFVALCCLVGPALIGVVGDLAIDGVVGVVGGIGAAVAVGTFLHLRRC